MPKGSLLAIGAIAMAGSLVMGAPNASADIVLPSTLNFTNDTALGAGPFGTVNITRIGVTSDFLVTFTANTAGHFFFINNNAADLNLNTSEFGSFTFVNTCATCTTSLSHDTTGGSNVDGLGDFNLRTTLGNASTNFSTLV